MKTLRVSDTARQRELFKYYQPTSLPLDQTKEPKVLRASSNDLSLIAFAQLGALRLNAKRVVISLVGRDTEYIIAEASKTLSLQDDNRHHDGDQLWHGVGPLQGNALMGLVLMGLLGGTSQPALPHLIVSDLVKDERFCQLPIVCAAPFARFLACLPLRTAAGYVIGLYTVIDDKPRDNLDNADILFLEDMARTTMDHLESCRVKQKHHRAERMIKALNIFLEGGDSIRNWWITQGREGQNIQQSGINEDSRRGVSFSQQADRQFGVQDPADRYFGGIGMRGIRKGDVDAQVVVGDGRPPVPTSLTSSRVPSTILSTELPTIGTAFRQESVTSEDPPMTSKENTGYNSTTGAGPSRFDIPQQTLALGKGLQEALLSNDMKRTFGRASNLIREAIDVDGITFFDASIGSFGARSEGISMNEKAPGPLMADTNVDTTTSGSDEERKRAFESSSVESTLAQLIEGENYTSILGYSTRSRSSINDHSELDSQPSLSESQLRQLAKRYPHGKIFNFDESGSISSSDSEIQLKTDLSSTTSPEVASDESRIRRKQKKKISREEDAAHILNIVQGARSVIWFPLWDPALERWYAGTLLWSLSPTRVFSPEELTYMATFGNSIMAEVSRLSALVASQLKVDFVSSISHELRSPLHGILASVEFLEEDGCMTDGQADMINTIHNCGRTLLQTVDHVLDFTKITNQMNEKTPRNRLRKHLRNNYRSSKGSDTSRNEASDLHALTEEVIDSVYAGTRFSEASSNSRLGFDNLVSNSPPVIVVDIAWLENWTFDINDGAWRRVLMNIFSNAVKYTKRGFVRVAVFIKRDSILGKRIPHPRLCLEVSDSGTGISEEFLKNHIYTAFKQENSFSVGTGLGLSIVRQLLVDLSGNIDIKSEVGEGTKVSVSIPLLPVRALNQRENEDIVGKARRIAAGSKACLLNSAFNLLPAMTDAPTGILSPEAEALMLLKTSISSIITDWLSMEVTTSSELDLSVANVHVTIASESVEEDIRAAETEFLIPGTTTVIVICNALLHKQNYVTDHGVQVFYLQQPVTPRKFASVISRAFASPHTSAQVLTTTVEDSARPLQLRTSANGSSLDYFSQASGAKVPSPHGSGLSLQGITPMLDAMLTRGVQPGSSDSIDSALPSQKRSKVLLVEDNEINLKLLVMCMKKLKHDYVTAINGHEAVTAYKAAGTPFDVIFMDIQMPIQDGLSATRDIRNFERENHFPPAAIIALTGAGSAAVRQEAFSSGIDLFLTKPVAMKSLKKIIHDFEEKGREALSQV
ncbi:hypothetical protein V494_02016 [Pseudogymnoascus sp. VKM F-4513 (FW-928)]|nr:hypothetical protein V494_02016 [Pseudogymnoascus sp. VKM F-4513 (FW-928)]